jgi:hypothetical protein
MSQRIGGQWREKEVLLENPYSRSTVSRPDVRLVVARQTYALEPGRTVIALCSRETLFSPNVL